MLSSAGGRSSTRGNVKLRVCGVSHKIQSALFFQVVLLLLAQLTERSTPTAKNLRGKTGNVLLFSLSFVSSVVFAVPSKNKRAGSN